MTDVDDAYESDDIRDFLAEDGSFAFEEQIVQLVTKHGYDPIHGGHYVDPVTGKFRQFDIRVALREWALGPEDRVTLLFRASLSIECKRLTAPVVVTATRAGNDDRLFIPALRYEEWNEGWVLWHPTAVWPLVDSACFRAVMTPEIAACVGRSIDQPVRRRQNGKPTLVQAKSNDRSDTYDKWSQSISSAVDAMAESCRDMMAQDSLSKGTLWHLWSMPILVVPDGMLFVSRFMDGQHAVELGDAVRCKVGLKRISLGPDCGAKGHVQVSCFYVMTEGGLGRFLQRLGARSA